MRTLWIYALIITALMMVACAGTMPDSAQEVSVEGSTYNDISTGLTWMTKELAQKTFWRDSNDNCLDLQFAGYEDWRLPTLVELSSIVDKANKPAIKEGMSAKPKCSWTSEASSFGGSHHTFVVKYVDFKNGKVGKKESGPFAFSDCYTRCVRKDESQ